MTPILTTTSGAVAEILAYTGSIFTDLWVIVALVIGIPLAFYIIRKVIGLVRGRTR
jgi:hypothetical protein